MPTLLQRVGGLSVVIRYVKPVRPLCCHTYLFLQPQARLDQCKVTMETLEKQLEEEKQKARLAEKQRGAGTGKEQEARFLLPGPSI